MTNTNQFFNKFAEKDYEVALFRAHLAMSGASDPEVRQAKLQQVRELTTPASTDRFLCYEDIEDDEFFFEEDDDDCGGCTFH